MESSEDFSTAIEFIKYTNEAGKGQTVPEVRHQTSMNILWI